MRLKGVLVVLLLMGLLVGCAASAKRINNLQQGMTKAEVIDIMGEPDYTSSTKDVEILSYRLASGGVFKETYFVRISNGTVDRFGRRGDFGYFY
jgi:hypothetical protein